MKKIKFGLVLVLSIFMSVYTSCDNEPLEGEFDMNDGENGGGNQTGSFQVDFDDQTFVAEQISATLIDGVINITGLRGTNQEAIILTINETTIGTYQFGVGSSAGINGATYLESNGSSNVWFALTDGIESQGEITISEINEINLTMSGTFSFTGFIPSGESKVFTNGAFININFED